MGPYRGLPPALEYPKAEPENGSLCRIGKILGLFPASPMVRSLDASQASYHAFSSFL
jgi:hypothetical protein